MKTLAPWILALSVCLTSCTSGPYAQRAAAGGIIGRSVGGAAVGAGLGALGGNLIGGQRDQRNRQY
jgi:5'-3' exoribonuclease 2